MKKIFILVLLCSALCLSHSFETNTPHSKFSNILRRLDEYATTSGQIPLTLGDSGFLVHVDFSDYKNLTTEPADSTTDYGNMVIALYTDQTFFGTHCQGFQDYCVNHFSTCNASNYTTTTVSTFPYFSSNSTPILPELYLDYNHWFRDSLESTFASTDNNSCQYNYSVGGYGLIGMGVSKDSKLNFNGVNPNFAINIAKNLSSGTFAFNVDMTQAKSDSPKATITTDSNWRVPKVDSIDMKTATFDANASLIFDLGSDSIGLPKRLYDQVLSAIENHPSVGKCSIGLDFRPTCEFTGDIRKLPSIKLNIGDQTIEIPAEVYVVQTQNSSFYYDPIMLKIKSLSTDGEGLYVTPDYQNYIILGFPVMSYYYTVFQAGDSGEGTISMYLSSDVTSASDMLWIFIVAGVLGLFLIGGTFYVFEKKYRKNKELMQPLMGEPVKFRGQGKRIQDEKLGKRADV